MSIAERQLPLFSEPRPKPRKVCRRKPKAPTIEARFWAFHAEQPQILALLRAKALDLRARGFKRYGLKALFETLRHDPSVQTGAKPFKLDNGFTAHYSRLLMETTPLLQEFFETRKAAKP
jgi:hypothetical protein